MADQPYNNSSAVVLAFIMGAFSGAAFALLFAPASGEETREFLGQKAREGRARAREAIDYGLDMYERERQHVAGAVHRGREAFEQARAAGEHDA
jgi:gas vesicle protein